MEKRIYNFSAGPAVLPEEVLLEAQKELSGIPGFVREKIKRNTEKFASNKNLTTITLEVMYAAKEALV